MASATATLDREGRDASRREESVPRSRWPTSSPSARSRFGGYGADYGYSGNSGRGAGLGEMIVPFILSFLFVDWIAGMAVPKYAYGVFVGWSWSKIGWTFAVCFALMTVWGKSLINLQRSGEQSSLGSYVSNKIANMLDAVSPNNPFVRGTLGRWKNMEGKEPEIVFRNKWLFFRMMDMERRYAIHLGMENKLKQMANEANEVVKMPGAEPSPAVLKKKMRGYRSRKGKIGNFGEEEQNPDPNGSSEHGQIGWAFMNRMVVDFYNEAKKELSKKEIDPQWVSSAWGTFTDMKRVWESSKVEYEKKLKFAKLHQRLRADALMLDIFNCSGDGYHPYLFDENGVEVNTYGEKAEDVRRNIRQKHLTNPRLQTRWAPQGSHVSDVMGYMIEDMTGFIENFETGKDFRGSRSLAENIQAWKNGIFDQNDPKWWPPKGASAQNPAFDLRALEDGKYRYPGRAHYSQGGQMSNDADPLISLDGVARGYEEIVAWKSKQISQDWEFLQRHSHLLRQIEKPAEKKQERQAS